MFSNVDNFFFLKGGKNNKIEEKKISMHQKL